MSGTGKSTVVAELRARGYRAVDMDEPGWSVHAPDVDWVWHEERLQTLLERVNPRVDLDGAFDNIRMKCLCTGETIAIPNKHDIEISRFPVTFQAVEGIHALFGCIGGEFVKVDVTAAVSGRVACVRVKS